MFPVTMRVFVHVEDEPFKEAFLKRTITVPCIPPVGTEMLFGEDGYFSVHVESIEYDVDKGEFGVLLYDITFPTEEEILAKVFAGWEVVDNYFPCLGRVTLGPNKPSAADLA